MTARLITCLSCDQRWIDDGQNDDCTCACQPELELWTAGVPPTLDDACLYFQLVEQQVTDCCGEPPRSLCAWCSTRMQMALEYGLLAMRAWALAP